MKTMKAAELVLDFDLYPRNNIDQHNVRSLMDALATGVSLPPVLIDKKSKRVVDGFHRVRAYLAYLGDDARIEVVEKTYKDDSAIFLEAMRLNAQHGAKLDPCDRTRCTIIAERLSISLDDVAVALHMPKEKLGELKASRTATGPTGLTIPLKRTIQGSHGKTLTKRQVEANERLSGMNQQFYANQLIELIEAKLLDMDDEQLMKRLRLLHELLNGILTVQA